MERGLERASRDAVNAIESLVSEVERLEGLLDSKETEISKLEDKIDELRIELDKQ